MAQERSYSKRNSIEDSEKGRDPGQAESDNLKIEIRKVAKNA